MIRLIVHFMAQNKLLMQSRDSELSRPSMYLGEEEGLRTPPYQRHPCSQRGWHQAR